MMKYKPEIGDVVNHWRCGEQMCERIGLDCVVIKIGVDDCLVRFKDGEETYIFVNNLTFISRPANHPQTI